MEAIAYPIESAPGWEQQQDNEARRYASEAGFAAPEDMGMAHGLMSEQHKFLVCDILRLAIAVTENSGLRIYVEWAGPQKGLIVRYYLPGNERACEHDIWFDLDGEGEARRKLLQIRDTLAHLSGLHGHA